MLKKLLLEIIWPYQISNIIWTGLTLDPLINVESMLIVFEDFASTHSSFSAQVQLQLGKIVTNRFNANQIGRLYVFI